MSEIRLMVRIPRERIGVLIGPGGSVKKKIEELGEVRLNVDSESGTVEIIGKPNMSDPAKALQVQNVVLAIGRGFSPERAWKLFEEDVMLDIIDLREYFGHSKSNMERVRGRIIGTEGKTRRIIEEMTKTSISVYGHTIAIIGLPENVAIAREAVQMLIEGKPHSAVYRFLHRKRREMKRRELMLWEVPGG